MTPQDVGIAISAFGSIVLVAIQVVRFRIERSHVVVRLSIGEPDFEDPASAHVSAAVFNRGRPAFIDGMWLHLGKDKYWIGGEAKKGQELPVDLATGRSCRIGFDLGKFEDEVEQAASAFGYEVGVRQ